MPLADDLLEREQSAGNAEDGLNRGQQASDNRFNRKNTDDTPEADYETPAYTGSRINSDGDVTPINYNADDPSEDVRDKETNPDDIPSNNPDDQKGKISGLSGHLRKYGASAGIVTILIGGLGASSALLIPGALMIFLEKGLTNHGAESTRTNLVMHRAYVGSIFSKKNPTSDLTKKLTGINDTQKTLWEKNGFKLETNKIADTPPAYRITKATFPDGKEVASSADFLKHIDNNIAARNSYNRVLNPRADFFNKNPKFDKIMKKFGLKKSNILESSRSKDRAERKKAIDASFDEKTGATTGDTEARAKAIREKSVGSKEFKAKIEKVKTGLGKASAATVPISALCAGYSAVKITTATVKAKYIFDLIKFSFPFIQAAAQLEDQGNIEPEVVENIADRLTWYQRADTATTDEEKAKANLTAMDSQGIKAAIYGDYSELQDFTRQYTTGWIGAGIAGAAITRKAEDAVGGKENIHNACALNAGVATASSVLCLAGPFALGACLGGIAAVMIFADDVLKKISEEVGQEAITRIAEANLNSSLRGVSLGDGLAAGVGLFLMQSNMGAAMIGSSNVAQVEGFISSTDNLDYKYGEELARYDAKQNPFDMYNQFSFLGTLATSLNQYRSKDSTAYSVFANIFAVGGSPLNLMSTSVSALYSQPSQTTVKKGNAEGMMGRCTDEDIVAIGVLCDISGRITMHSSKGLLKMADESASGSSLAIEDVEAYMLSNKYIDTKGKATGDTNPDGPEGDTESDGVGSQDDAKYNYIKYKNYCTSERVDPIGTSSKSLLDGTAEDQDWYTYKRCRVANPADVEMFDNFAFYNNYCETQYPMNNGVKDCWSSSDVAAAPTNSGAAIPANGPWTCPVNTGAGGVLTQGPHDIGNGTASGVDYGYGGNPIGPPGGIYAVRDGTVVTAAPASGYGNWIIIQHEENGQRIDSYYGHMQSQHMYVKPGQVVKAGDHIADQGTEGNSSGPHVHVGLKMYPGSPSAQDYETRFMASC